MKTALTLGCVVLAASSLAFADDTFEKKAQGAIRVKALDEVVWALTAPCDKGDELQQRQCRLVRDARAKTYAGATLVLDGDTAFTPGAWNGAARSVSQLVTACIRCGGITVEGRAWYLTGSTAHQDGAKIAAAPLFDNARQFPNEARAKTWLASVAKTPHEPHLLRPGGFLLLLGLLRWRRSDGRLLATLSLVPQTTALYETLPLALLCQNRPQAACYAGLTMLAHLLFQLGPQGPWPVGAGYQWWVLLVLVYLPAIALVLRRPNEAGPDWGPA